MEDEQQLKLRIAELEQSLDALRSQVEKAVEAHKKGVDPAPLFQRLGQAVHEQRNSWTQAVILEKVRQWNALYGEPPASGDWNPNKLMRELRTESERANRFFEDIYPSYSAAMKHFPSWNQMIAAAGLEPRTEGGQAGNKGGGGPDLDNLPVWTGWQHFAHQRTKIGLTQGAVAHSAGIGVSHYADLENGRHTNPGIRILIAVARALMIPTAALVEAA